MDDTLLSNSSGERNAVVTLTETTEIDGGEYSSENDNENVIVSSGEEVLLPDLVVTKTIGEELGDSTLPGANAAVVVTNGTLKIPRASIKTSSSDSSALFIYQKGNIELEEGSLGTAEQGSPIITISGDAEKGTGSVSIQTSSIEAINSDILSTSNTVAKISLSGNKITSNSENAFLRSKNSETQLSLSSQVVSGDIILDSTSTLSLTLSSESYYKGAINNEETASSISLELDESSSIVLTADSYVSSLENANLSNSNIYSNGYNLYVAGTQASINEADAPEMPEVVLGAIASSTQEPATDCFDENGIEIDCLTAVEPVTTAKEPAGLSLPLVIALVVCGVLIIGLIVFAILKLKKKAPNSPETIIDPSIPRDNPFALQTPPTVPPTMPQSTPPMAPPQTPPTTPPQTPSQPYTNNPYNTPPTFPPVTGN